MMLYKRRKPAIMIVITRGVTLKRIDLSRAEPNGVMTMTSEAMVGELKDDSPTHSWIVSGDRVDVFEKMMADKGVMPFGRFALDMVFDQLEGDNIRAEVGTLATGLICEVGYCATETDSSPLYHMVPDPS